ncbi:MAG: TlyA family RNA methyltransferase [Desulfopila sp.]
MKRRLDELLIERGLASDSGTARALIMAGSVLVDETVADKAGRRYPVDAQLRVRQKCRYVSRGGLKLERGLQYFGLEVTGRCCLDIGASSGGFTDCLLQHGAGKVFAVDVAYGQLDWQIRTDRRVVVMERFNARKLTPELLGQPVDLTVIDASFISLTALLPVLPPLFADNPPAIVCLIKPQFELAKAQVGRGGVVRDPALHQEAIDRISDFAASIQLRCHATVASPILGPKGNREFLAYLGNPR